MEVDKMMAATIKMYTHMGGTSARQNNITLRASTNAYKEPQLMYMASQNSPTFTSYYTHIQGIQCRCCQTSADL